MAEDGPWKVVQKINKMWRSGDVDGLGELFHPDAVVVHPGFEDRAQGRAACVDSYREFAGLTTVTRLDEFDQQVDVVGDTAVVTYGFRIDYEMDGKANTDRGHDVFVLKRGGGGWKVVWRTVVLEG